MVLFLLGKILFYFSIRKTLRDEFLSELWSGVFFSIFFVSNVECIARLRAHFLKNFFKHFSVLWRLYEFLEDVFFGFSFFE